MRDGRVVAIPGEVLGADLPVGVGHPVVGRPVHLDALRPVLEVEVQVKAEVTQVLGQRRCIRAQSLRFSRPSYPSFM